MPLIILPHARDDNPLTLFYWFNLRSFHFALLRSYLSTPVAYGIFLNIHLNRHDDYHSRIAYSVLWDAACQRSW